MARTGIGDSVEGLHAVAAALEAGRVLELFVDATREERVAEMLDGARSAGVTVTVVGDVRVMAHTTAPQGVVARCRPLETVSIDDLAAMHTPAALMIVDHVEDPHNLGAIVRSAVAAGIPRIAIPTRRGAPLGGAAFKAAAGALERATIAEISSVADAVKRLGAAGVWSVGLDAGGETSLFGLGLLAEPVAIVIGGETGLGRLVSERVDVLASIPMAGPVESLNASVAAALAMFETARRRGWLS